MNEEYDSLLKNHTWDLVDLPPGRFTVKNKWIYKCKPKADGSIDRYKARLVAKGYSQSYGIDYDETYAPVAKADNIHTLSSIAAAEDYELVQFDIKTTFLHGDLSEDIYMDQPLGFEHPGGKVCHLRKSLYGLKQANRCWNQKFNTFLVRYDLQPTTTDSCVHASAGEPTILLTIVVDDGLAACKDIVRISAMISYLQERFEVTSSLVEVYIGMRITRDRFS